MYLKCPIAAHKTYSDVNVIANSILPSIHDDDAINKRNIATPVSRVLVSHLKFFKLTFEDVVEQHFHHPYYAEMSMKSIVVSFMLIIK